MPFRWAISFITSLYSSTTLFTSRPVSLCKRMSRIACDCFSERLKLFMRPSFATKGSLLARIIFITSSMLSRAIFKPSRMCARDSAAFKSNSVRRTTISCLKSIKCSSASFRGIIFGTPPTNANKMMPKVS